jgi:hypothetical protein
MLTVTSLPGRHARGWTQALLPPVMGTMFEFGPTDGAIERRLYVSGDTLLIEDLKEIPIRFAAIDAGVLHLGGTRLPAGWLPFGLTKDIGRDESFAGSSERFHARRLTDP